MKQKCKIAMNKIKIQIWEILTCLTILNLIITTKLIQTNNVNKKKQMNRRIFNKSHCTLIS